MKMFVASVALFVALGALGCSQSRTESVADPAEIAAYRQDLHNAIDRITELAARRDAIQGQVELVGVHGSTGSKIGEKCLRELLELLERREDELRKSVDELLKKLNSRG